jgi:midasin (ATPase involved in ribosome maturation)
VEFVYLARPVVSRFVAAFCKSFSRTGNAKFLKGLRSAMQGAQWVQLFALMRSTIKRVQAKIDDSGDSGSTMRPAVRAMWRKVNEEVSLLEHQSEKNSSFAFSFVEGALVSAIRDGPLHRTLSLNLAFA